MPVADASPVEVRLLGPLDVVVAGQTVHIGSPKQRAVLALLALQAGRTVNSAVLCDLLWATDPPAWPLATLQSLVSRLRAALGSRGDVIRTSGSGWILDVEPGAVDALRFEELTARARARTDRGDPAAAAADLAEALELWRGAALVDVVDAGYLAPQATRLNQARLDAVEDLAEAELATGRAVDALARMEQQVEGSPLRERAWGLLMLALYRLGRQAAALRSFQQVRAILAEELGIDPSPELRDLEQRILRHDPGLSPGVAATGEFGDYSVVVVEDHDFQRRTVVHLLRGLGVGQVAEAADGTAALLLLESGPPPDIIICDIDMPGMDGVEFVAHVAERNLASAVVIASGLDAQVLRAVEAIGEGHGLLVLAALPKPLTARRLGEVLRLYTRPSGERVSHLHAVSLDLDELRAALERGDVGALFTPRIDLVTGAFSGAAAGVSLSAGPGLGAPSPLPLVTTPAQENLALPFVERLLAESCALVDAVDQAGLDGVRPPRVTVDVSRLSLADPTLADRLAATVHGTGQQPRRFVCQLDEVALARAPATAMQTLTRLRVKGFGVAMRHGGSGPSWTHQVERAPLSEVALDRRLVADATSDAKRLAALEAALVSAHDRGYPVVAEGCDSRADFDLLLALGCDEVQGRCVAEPMGREDLVSWVLAGCITAAQDAHR